VRIFSVDKYGEDSVIQRWSALLGDQADMSTSFLDRVTNKISEKGFGFSNHRESISTKLSSYDVREFLVINLNNDFSCYVSAIKKGKDLAVTWLIQDHMIKGVYKLPFIGPLLIAVFKRYTFAMTNDVIAFALATKEIVISVTEDIMDEKMLDKTRLRKRSSGKLGPI
jgi:hypothetical protein